MGVRCSQKGWEPWLESWNLQTVWRILLSKQTPSNSFKVETLSSLSAKRAVSGISDLVLVKSRTMDTGAFFSTIVFKMEMTINTHLSVLALWQNGVQKSLKQRLTWVVGTRKSSPIKM